MSTHTIEGACPKCHETINIVVNGEVDGKLNVTCDYCGINKTLMAFQKELSRQEQKAERLLSKAKADREMLEKRKAEIDQREADRLRRENEIAEIRNLADWNKKHGDPFSESVTLLYFVSTVCIVIGLISFLATASGTTWILCAISAFGFASVCAHLRKATYALQAIRDNTGFEKNGGAS